MNLIDTNGIVYVFKHSIDLSDDYLLAPDVKDESEVSEIVHEKRLPDCIFEISETDLFDQAIYLKHYQIMLNKHPDRSFFNMTGFGDISILASIHMLLEMFTKRKTEELFDPTEDIDIYTGDVPLIKKINKEFGGKSVFVHPLAMLG